MPELFTLFEADHEPRAEGADFRPGRTAASPARQFNPPQLDPYLTEARQFIDLITLSVHRAEQPRFLAGVEAIARAIRLEISGR